MQKNDDCIAIYSRKSKYTGKGESVGNQIELCKEYIRNNFGDEYAQASVVFEDEGFSGGDLNRPDFKRMMKAAHERKFKAIVVYRLDRISRNISDFSGLIEELAGLDISFVSIREQFDTATPMGRAMMYIASVFSQLERETIAERIRDNMHELAKTGRWLGGTTPTGYTSESVMSVTLDGKTKKACKLKLIPEEAQTVKLIYELFLEFDSLTNTEAEILRRRIKTKTGKDFTRFSIKAILQNPVYMIADKDAYGYFSAMRSELFSELAEFDGEHGILAYNRTDQVKGKATVYLPPDEWIVSVGQHPGIIPAKTWIKVQQSLERNKSKGYRKPRSNEALLTGLLFCRCGSRMYPKLTKRMSADGEPVYTYVCKMKERSKKSLCDLQNLNGNVIDTEIIGQIKALTEDISSFISLLERSRKIYSFSGEQPEEKLARLRCEQADNEKKITALVDSLAEMGESDARYHVTKRIEELHISSLELDSHIAQLEGVTALNTLSDTEFDAMRQKLADFNCGVDDMTVEQKRAAVRNVVKQIIWDGQNAHVLLFGVSKADIAYPEPQNLFFEESCAEEAFSHTCFDGREDGSKNPALLCETKTHWGEDSK